MPFFQEPDAWKLYRGNSVARFTPIHFLKMSAALMRRFAFGVLYEFGVCYIWDAKPASRRAWRGLPKHCRNAQTAPGCAGMIARHSGYQQNRHFCIFYAFLDKKTARDIVRRSSRKRLVFSRHAPGNRRMKRPDGRALIRLFTGLQRFSVRRRCIRVPCLQSLRP